VADDVADSGDADPWLGAEPVLASIAAASVQGRRALDASAGGRSRAEARCATLCDRLIRACLWDTTLCAVRAVMRVSNVQSALCRWGRGAVSYNGSSENQRQSFLSSANPSYRHRKAEFHRRCVATAILPAVNAARVLVEVVAFIVGDQSDGGSLRQHG